MAAPIVHVEVRGLDQPELAAFYEEVFGWRRDPALSIDTYSVTDLGSGPLTAATGPVPEWSVRSCTFYIQAGDIEETLGRIESAGGRRVMDRTVGPEFGSRHVTRLHEVRRPGGQRRRTRRAAGRLTGG